MGLFRKLKEKRELKKDRSGNKQIIQLTYIMVGLFLALIVYISVFVSRDSAEVINNSYNSREELFEEKIIRGSILDRNGTVIAYTESNNVITEHNDEPKNEDKRIYPYNNAFAHVVGYNVKGKMGIENTYNYSMLKSDMIITERVNNDLQGNKNVGNSVVTTLDVNCQLAAYEALGDRRGAVVCIDATTGDILALVSKPDFDPNHIAENWQAINADSNSSVLLNRATQGIYPPGSTFKIITALEYIKENNNFNDYDFECKGSFSYDGSTINCYHGMSHGEVDFEKSFAKSCNSSFANITTKLNKEKFETTCEELLFNDDLPSPISNTKKSVVPINAKSSTDELIQTGIGQGLTGVTPYHLCLITAAIANDGVLMEPRLVSKIVTANDDIVKEYGTKEYRRLISSEDSEILKELMREVVLSGTATRIKDTNNYEAYGKTGSAEFSSDKSASHAWFTGFANYGGKKVAVTVIIEEGGSGGEKAVPVAKSVLDALGE